MFVICLTLTVLLTAYKLKDGLLLKSTLSYVVLPERNFRAAQHLTALLTLPVLASDDVRELHCEVTVAQLKYVDLNTSQRVGSVL